MHNCKVWGLVMESKYIRRALEPVLKKASREFPAVLLTGPRQAGKTTILKQIFGDSHGYVSLDVPDIRLAAMTDPRGFLAAFPPPVILDEVQHVPELLAYIKEWVDSHRQDKGQFILSGSQNILLMSNVTETLAGRTAVLRLMPLSYREISGHPAACLPWSDEKARSFDEHLVVPELWKTIVRGCYPELWVEPEREISFWYSSYIQTYLERDVRGLRQIGDLSQFQSFLQTVAARSAQLLNLADISSDLGIALNTVKAWLSVLEATHQVVVVRPYFANIGKRLVKTPKVYFTDVGMVCHLVGLSAAKHASSGPMAGALMESAVFSEIYKTLLNEGVEPGINFWRTSSGNEVDFLVRNGAGMVPIEVKASATPAPIMSRGIQRLRKDLGGSCHPGYVVHAGSMSLPLGSNVTALPFGYL